MSVLNAHYETSKKINIEGLDEKTGRKIEFTIDFSRRRITQERGITEHELATLLWKAGILNLKTVHGTLVEEIIRFLQAKGRRVKALALDTNIILDRFAYNLIRQAFSRVSEQFNGLIIIPGASLHEFHYKASYTFRSKLEILTNRIDDDVNIGLLLCNSNNSAVIRTRLARIKNYQGRLGHKGEWEVLALQDSLPVILSCPDHLYYSQRIQTDAEFVDAVFDSLIRLEIQSFRKNTNADVLFLTADKDQYVAAMSEGSSASFIPVPISWEAILREDTSHFNLNYVQQFLWEFLIFSPYLIIRTGSSVDYITGFWHDKTPSENLDGILMGWSEENRRQQISL